MGLLYLLLHIYDINGHYCIFVGCIPLFRWPKKAETCRRITTCLYTVVSVGMCMMICITARKMGNFKFKDPNLFQEAMNQYFVSARCVPL
jgi:hypothetical protein